MLRYILPGIVILFTTLAAESRITSHSATAISLEFNLPQINSEAIQLDGQDYVRLEYEGADFLRRSGAPLLPYSVIRVAIPPEAQVSGDFQIVLQEELAPVNLLPAILVSGLKSDNLQPLDQAIYGSANPFPGDIVKIGEPYLFRSLRVVDITVYPVQYHPAEQRARLLKRITIQLKLKNARPALGSAPRGSKHLLRETVLNFQQAQNWAVNTRSLSKQTVTYDFSTGDWYRLPVTGEGIYRLSGSFLSEQGIGIASINLGTVQMFSNGGDALSIRSNDPVADDLSEVAIDVLDRNGNGTMDSDDEIIFYGVAERGWRYNPGELRYDFYLNPYASQNYYLLTFNRNAGKRIAREDSPNFGNAVRATAFTDRYRFEQDAYNILESGLNWYWLKFQGTSQSQSIAFNLPGNIIAGNATLSLSFQGGSGSRYYEPSSGFDYSFAASVNGFPLVSNINISQNNPRTVENINTTALIAGENSLNISYTGSQDGCVAYFDYLSLELQRGFSASGDQLKFYYTLSSTPNEFLITNLNGSENRVWDITDFADVKEINPLDNNGQLRFHADSPNDDSRTYQVFGRNAFKTVTALTRLENHANLRNPARRGRLLVITPDEFYDAAEPLEVFKETQVQERMETERVRTSDIYKEFSSGVADPTAIRNFIKYAYENWGSDSTDVPEYVLLLGDGSYDYRNIQLTSYINRIPTFQVTAKTDIDSRATDNYYTAIFNTSTVSSLTPQLALGRIPANSVAEVENYIGKLIRYDQSFLHTAENLNGWQNTMTFVADDECPGSRNCTEWFHLRQSEEISGYVPQRFDLVKIYLTDYETETGGLGRLKPRATTDLLNQINRGTLMINFYGHGDPNTWAHEQVLTRGRDLPFINSGNRMPVWIAATCTWGQYDDPNTPSMAEAVIWAQGGGIVSIAASRPTFAFSNERFVEFVYGNLFRNRNNQRRSLVLGDAVVASLGSDINSQKYHLFGDPSLRLADPEHQVQITSFSSDTLKALSKVSLQARIVDDNGNPLTNFNGKALIRVFDAADTSSKGGVAYRYTGGTIFKGIVSVENGLIGVNQEASFKVPKSIKYRQERTGRLSIYAWSENSRDAGGSVDSLLFLGSESEINDPGGPDIDFAFPAQPDFFDGDFVQQQSSISIRLEDESGINLTGEVGHRIELLIDETIRKDVTEFFVYDENSFQKGELLYTLPALASGRHAVTITAWDNLNNYAEKTLTFTTSNVEDATLTQVINYPNPMSEDTQFTFQFLSPAGSGEATVKIYTINGRQIQELRDTALPGFNKIYWDGRDRDGDIISNGVYIYKLVVDDGEKVVEKREKLVISR